MIALLDQIPSETKIKKHLRQIIWGKNMSCRHCRSRKIYALRWCWTQKVPVLQTISLCHVSEPTVRYWFRQFRVHLPEFEPILNGRGPMDEAYFKNLSLIMAQKVGSTELGHQ